MNQLIVNIDFCSQRPSKHLRHRGSFELGGSRDMRKMFIERNGIHHNWAYHQPISTKSLSSQEKPLIVKGVFTNNKGLTMTKPLMMSGFRRNGAPATVLRKLGSFRIPLLKPG